MSQTPAQRLIRRLRAAGLALPDDVVLTRLYRRREYGDDVAWAWMLTGTGMEGYGRGAVGSPQPVRDLLAYPRLFAQRQQGDWEVGVWSERMQRVLDMPPVAPYLVEPVAPPR